MTALCKTLAESETFQSFILFLILATALVMGLETVPELVESYSTFFLVFDYASQSIFILEIIIRILAYAPSYRRFFDEIWNTFDFFVVALSLLPAVGSFALAARLLRVVRLLRAVSVSDKLRRFTERLPEALDEIIYTSLLTAVLGYVFALSGCFLFADAAPQHWGTLSRSGLSVFYLLLLQDVPSFVEPVLSRSGLHIVYFITFYLVFVSLFVSALTAAIAESVRGYK